MQLPSMNQFFGNDPIQMFNDMIRQFHERAKNFEQSIRTSIGENGEVQKLPGFDTLPEFPKSIPIIRIPLNGFDVSNDEQNDAQRMMNDFQHHFGQFRHGNVEQKEPENNRFQQFFTDVRTEWNDLIRKQPKIPIWIFLAIFLSSSAILWCMLTLNIIF